MYRLAVDPGHRRRGIARRLVEAGESSLRERGARRITALLVSDDPEATALWKAAGYEHDERMGRFVKTL